MWNLLRYSDNGVTKIGQIAADVFVIIVLIVIFAAPILHRT